jgi:hypothetical protein
VSQTDEVVSIVRETAAKAGVQDRCQVDLEEGVGEVPTIVTLEAANPKAAKLLIQLDHEAQITFYVGRHGTVAEDFNRNEAELLETVRSFVLLAISGNYRECVKESERKAIARFRWPDSGKRGGFSYNVLIPRRWSTLSQKGWQEEIYDAF